jgi:Ser/Thr protein kinase RdoA (MazF antagonist)
VAGEGVAWQRPGWLAEVSPVIDVALAGCGLRRTGPAGPVRLGGISAILRIPTSGRPVWFKAVPPLFAHESRVVAWLGAREPDAVPTVLASGDAWWIAADVPDEAGTPRGDWLEAHASTQVASIGRVDELLALGCPRRSLEALPVEVMALADRERILGRERSARLRLARAEVERLCAEVSALGIAPTLVHGDLHRENVRWTGRAWLRFDWTDACIAHPFVDLALPLSTEPEEARARRATGYGAVWSPHLAPPSLEVALRTAPAIGAAHQVASYRRILDAIGAAAREQTHRRTRDWVDQLLEALRGHA